MNLTVIQNYRTHLESVLRAELAELELAVHVASERRGRLQAEAESATRRWMAESRRGATGQAVAAGYTDFDVRAALVYAAGEALTEVRRRWEHKRAEVVDAMRERKKVEMLAQRHAVKRGLQNRRRERYALDEAARDRFLRAERSMRQS